MTDVLTLKKEMLELVKSLNSKYELSKTVDENYYEPGMMENLEQYKGEYHPETNIIVLRTEVKGLRYDNRTTNLKKLSIGDAVQISRDKENLFNTNNFTVHKESDSLGNLPAELCNALAPLFDAGYAIILNSEASYIEQLHERSRYAKQGVLFLEITIKIRGI